MRSFVVAVVLVIGFGIAGCSDDDDGGSNGGAPDVSGEDAQRYLADLEEAGLADLLEDDEAAVAFVPTACESAVVLQQTPEQLIESGEVSEQAAIALRYCDTPLNP
jgi:hypothetical protein